MTSTKKKTSRQAGVKSSGRARKRAAATPQAESGSDGSYNPGEVLLRNLRRRRVQAAIGIVMFDVVLPGLAALALIDKAKKGASRCACGAPSADLSSEVRVLATAKGKLAPSLCMECAETRVAAVLQDIVKPSTEAACREHIAWALVVGEPPPGAVRLDETAASSRARRQDSASDAPWPSVPRTIIEQVVGGMMWCSCPRCTALRAKGAN